MRLLRIRSLVWFNSSSLASAVRILRVRSFSWSDSSSLTSTVRLLRVRSLLWSDSAARFLLPPCSLNVGALGGPNGARPFPLSTGALEVRFSLSEETEAAGEGDIDW